MAHLPALIEQDPTFAPTRSAALALQAHLEDVYTDPDWAHAPDVRRALAATLTWLDATPIPAAAMEQLGIGPVWAAVNALVHRLQALPGHPGWAQDPAVLALVSLAGVHHPQSLADLRARKLPLDAAVLPPDRFFLPRLGRAWAAHLQTQPYLIAQLSPTQQLDELRAADLAHPAGYLAAFMGLVNVTYPGRDPLAIAIQQVIPESRGPAFPLGGLPVLPSPTVPVFIWLDLMNEALTHHLARHPPQRDTAGRAIVLLDPLLAPLKRAVADRHLPWLAAIDLATAQRQAGYDLSQALARLGTPVL